MRAKIRTGANSGLIDERGVFLTTFHGLNLPIALSALALVVYGLVIVYVASLDIADASLPRQAFGALIGLVGCAVIFFFDYRHLSDYVIALIILDAVLIVAPLIPGLGYYANGTTGWVRIPFVGLTFQTSELAKPVTVLLMAALGKRYEGHVSRLRDYVGLCIILCIPFALILLQPDLGTGLIILVAGAVVIVMSGPKKTWIFATLGLLLIFVVFVFMTDNIIDALVGDDASLIKDYQLNRILVFLNPNADTSDSGYNLQQALIAIGSGGLFGKGIGGTTQVSSGFLPAAHTDFVFALLCETFGFVGALLLLVLFAVLVFATIRVAYTTPNLFGRLILVGIAAVWLIQIFENVGMCMSVMPITGIPLPFISFGSSSMIVQLLNVGLVLSVCAHSSSDMPVHPS